MNLLHKVLVELTKKAFPYRSHFASLTRWPWLGKKLEHLLFEEDQIFFLPKIKEININQSVGKSNSMILPQDVLNHFIQQSRSFRIMNFCICRTSMECKHYPQKMGCLFLGPASQHIPDELGRSVTQEEAFAYTAKCREAGLVQMIGLNKLDSIWLQVSPYNQLLTICNCCPCCCLWRIFPQLSKSIKQKVNRMPGVKVIVSDLCTGCGKCQEDICFIKALQFSEKRAVISDDCLGCGRCVQVCPQKAIQLVIDSHDYVDQTIKNLNQLIQLDET